MVLSKKKLRQRLLALTVAADEGALSIRERMKEMEKARKKRKRENAEVDKKGRNENSAEGELLNFKKNNEDSSTKEKGKENGVNNNVGNPQQHRNVDGKKKRRKKENKDGQKDNPRRDSIGGGSGQIAREDAAAVVAAVNSEQSVKKVYVGGIPYYSTEDDIRSFFEKCGTITEIDCMKFPESGKFRGIAILTFKTEFAATRALALDGADMGGLFLKVQPYKSTQVQKTDFAPNIVEGYNKIYVGNLSWDITEDDLKKLFSSCQISSIRLGMDKETGEFKGYAHVDFSDSKSLAIALKLDQETLCGRPVRIRCALPGACKVCGVSGHLSSSCPSKKGQDGNLKKGHLKGRTCFQCGRPGHLSSSCPHPRNNEDSKKAAPGSSSHINTAGDICKASNSSSGRDASIAGGDTSVANDAHHSSKKKASKANKRRACYLCRTFGHLKSDCPNNTGKAPLGDSLDDGKTGDGNDETAKGSAAAAASDCLTGGGGDSLDDGKTGDGNDETAKGSAAAAASDSLTAGGGKKKKSSKRRTCYNCGIPGHLSSECPNPAKSTEAH